MKQLIWSAALVPMLLAGCAQTQQAADTTVAAAKAQVNPTLSTTDASFITAATRGGMAETRLAELALRNGRSPAVKSFARTLMTDHNAGNQELAALARRKEITPPEGIGAEYQGVYDDLAKLRGRAFDRAYAQAMVKDHEDDIREYQAEARDGTDPDVRAFAARTVPMLEQHLRAAQALMPGRTRR